MRTIREILRLRFELGRSHREIGRACRKSPATIGTCLKRFAKSGLTWPLPEELDDYELERRLYHKSEVTMPRPKPCWQTVHQELAVKNVTLALLWDEYCEAHKGQNPFNYAWFCRGYRKWAGRQKLVMRQSHKLGEKTFVDWAGTKVPIVDPKTGEIREASVFVATLGASSYTYAEAFPNERSPAWIAGHSHAFEYFGGTTEIVVPDNPKTGVTKADHYEPDINLTYQEWADHFKVAVIPARPRRPQDKAKVESAVRVASNWILARLRKVTFFSLSQLNTAIWELLVDLNEREFQKLPGSRKKVFDEQEKLALRPLPLEPYELAEWKKARVGPDYHVEVEGHYYSVPFTLVKELVEVRLSATMVKVLHRNRLVANHRRSRHRGQHTTSSEHMPGHHRFLTGWTPERFKNWALRSGPSVCKFVEELMERRSHPELAYRSCFGLLRLAREFGDDRLEAACQRALHIGAYRYKSVKSILESSLDKEPLPNSTAPTRSAGHHENVRGAAYYQQTLPFSDN